MKTTEEIIWLCAFRYCIGRTTYIVGIITDFLNENIQNMSEETKQILIQEIKECNNLGMDCDKEDWLNLLNNLENSLK